MKLSKPNHWRYHYLLILFVWKRIFRALVLQQLSCLRWLDGENLSGKGQVRLFSDHIRVCINSNMTNSNSTQLYNTHSNSTAQTIKFRQTLISLRGRRKKGREGGGKREKRESGKKGSVPYPLSPTPSLFPFLPTPYPFRRLLRRLIRVCLNLIVCAVCAKILKAENFLSSIFFERFFLLFASRWLLLTDGDLLTAYSTLSSVFCKQLFIVSLTIVSL